MRIHRGRVYEGSAAVLLAYVQDNDGTDITQADVTSITVKVYDRADDTLVATVTPTVSAVVFNALQTDDRWTGDGGYNLAIPLAGTNWPNPGNYRVQIHITPATGYPYAILYDLQAINSVGE